MTDSVPDCQARSLDLIRQAIVEHDQEARAELLRQASYWLSLSRRAASARLH
jgi:hypothetical protein